jgi:restriction system protein
VTVPDYQTLMAPALQALAGGTEQPISQLRGAIAKQIGLTDDDLKVTLPSGSPLFADRLYWTITYLHRNWSGSFDRGVICQCWADTAMMRYRR